MASRWSKRRKIRSQLKATEAEILQTFEEKFRGSNMQGSTIIIKHTDCQSVEIQSGLSASGPGTEDVPICEDWENEPNSLDNETHEPMDTVNDNDSDSEHEEEPSLEFLLISLRYWASKFSVSLVALTALLSILRVFHPKLPKDARTVLRTRAEVPTQEMEGGEYHHCGLATGLMSRLKALTFSGNTLWLQFNVDGLPLFKSSKLQFWPILATVNVDPTRSPFLVGLFCGAGKPKCVFEYLGPFIAELKEILEKGIWHNGRQILIKVGSFVCDAPARAFLKNIKGHNGYSGCDKCVQVGEWQGKMVFPEVNAKLRTDEDFNSMVDEDHHLNQTLSPLASVVKMVTMFPSDYMHSCCLGVTRKLLNIWIKGKSLKNRLGSRTITEISDKLCQLSPYTPTEFSRKPRALSEIDRWKATELRYLMLYAGPVVLNNSIPIEMYNNFLLFSVAMHLLLSPGTAESMIDCANELLISFVNHFGQLYGKTEITYVHGLTHLAAEYKVFGPLDNIACFPYENYLGHLKSLLHKPHLPLQQVVKRLSEMPTETDSNQNSHKYMHHHYDGPVVPHLEHGDQYRKVVTEKFTLTTNCGDNGIQILEDIGIVENIVRVACETFVIFRTFRKKDSYFQYPFPSSTIGLYKVSGLSKSISVVKLDLIKKKKNTYFTPIKPISLPFPYFIRSKYPNCQSVHQKNQIVYYTVHS